MVEESGFYTAACGVTVGSRAKIRFGANRGAAYLGPRTAPIGFELFLALTFKLTLMAGEFAITNLEPELDEGKRFHGASGRLGRREQRYLFDRVFGERGNAYAEEPQRSAVGVGAL